jgi:putative membrane protein
MDKGKPRAPESVYGVGTEPDSRFTLANERTYLAWIRTSLAIMAAGVAIEELQIGPDKLVRTLAAILLVGGGASLAVYSFARWKKIERAMRLQLPLPSLNLGILLSAITAVAGFLVVLLLIQ